MSDPYHLLHHISGGYRIKIEDLTWYQDGEIWKWKYGVVKMQFPCCSATLGIVKEDECSGKEDFFELVSGTALKIWIDGEKFVNINQR